jgi:hypothetical protein
VDRTAYKVVVMKLDGSPGIAADVLLEMTSDDPGLVLAGLESVRRTIAEENTSWENLGKGCECYPVETETREDIAKIEMGL